MHMAYTLFLTAGARWSLKTKVFSQHHILSINLQTVLLWV